MNEQIKKNFKFFIFVKFWKCAKKYYEIRKLFCRLFLREYDKATIEIEDEQGSTLKG